MGVLKLNKECGRCSIEVKNDSNAGVMCDLAELIGGLIAVSNVSRETWLRWLRSEEFEESALDMADVDYKWKRGEDHKKKSTGDRRR
jgi:hypothetical protein